MTREGPPVAHSSAAVRLQPPAHRRDRRGQVRPEPRGGAGQHHVRCVADSVQAAGAPEAGAVVLVAVGCHRACVTLTARVRACSQVQHARGPDGDDRRGHGQDQRGRGARAPAHHRQRHRDVQVGAVSRTDAARACHVRPHHVCRAHSNVQRHAPVILPLQVRVLRPRRAGGAPAEAQPTHAGPVQGEEPCVAMPS